MPREPQNWSPQNVLNTLNRNEMQVLSDTRVSMLDVPCLSCRIAEA